MPEPKPASQHPPPVSGATSLPLARRVLETEAQAILDLLPRLDTRFDRAVELLLACRGRVVLTGVGKSGIVARKVAATLSSTGTPAFFLHAGEAYHGDLGMVVPGDVVVALSYSGETQELTGLLEPLKRLGVPLISLTGVPGSTLGSASDVVIDVATAREACPLGLAPTASTTAMIAMGDALGLALLDRRGLRPEDFAERHPGGRLGSKLQRVEQVMHTGEDVPRVSPDAPMRDVIYEMSRKRLGITAVTGPDGQLLGCISDGDLRRLLQNASGEAASRDVLALTAAECMTRLPATIAGRELVAAAIHLMETRRITSLMVTSPERLVGIVHLHDLWATGLL